MATNACIPHFQLGKDVTGTVTTAAVKGKHFVKFVEGGRPGAPAIAPADAGEYPAGVAGHDQEIGGRVHFLAGGLVPVVAGADLTAGTRVEVDAEGKAIPLAAGIAVGVCTVKASTGADAAIRLSL